MLEPIQRELWDGEHLVDRVRGAVGAGVPGSSFTSGTVESWLPRAGNPGQCRPVCTLSVVGLDGSTVFAFAHEEEHAPKRQSRAPGIPAHLSDRTEDPAPPCGVQGLAQQGLTRVDLGGRAAEVSE